MPVQVAAATEADLAELADVAARTFPLACPPTTAPADVDAFIAVTLSPARFADYLADPGRAVLVGRDDGRIIGYAMLIRGVADDPNVQRAVPATPAVELSKMYVLSDAHGTGASAALMTAALEGARRLGAVAVWLGVNQQNHRAQRFYGKHGFEISGTKTFRLGESVEHDYVMVRSL